MDVSKTAQFEKRYAKEESTETQLSLRLSSAMVKALDDLAQMTGDTSKAETIRKAVGTQLLLHQAIKDGDEIILRKPDGTMMRLKIG